MNDEPPILVALGLKKTYPLGRSRLDVLRGIDLEVRRGEALVVVGASGAGKSTLLHLLGGLDTPSAGEVSLDGVLFFDRSAADRARVRNEQVGFVFQSYHLLPELDALENICLPAMLRGTHRQEARVRGQELLERVGLGERAEHRPNELSGGEQQRVAIARALINRPRLILADEPTGNLDSRTGQTILDLLEEMRQETAATLVTVTHDEHVAARGDRVLTIADGKLAE